MSLRTKHIRFMEIRRVSLVLSALLLLGSMALLMTKGLNLGIDFTGGIIVQVEFSSPVTVKEVRETLAESGQQHVTIQDYSDRGVIVRLAADDEASQKAVIDAMKKKDSGVNVLRIEKVGPVVGKQLREEAVVAVAVALVGILLYITVRFRFRFAVVSVVALLHDTILTLGLFSLLGREVSLTFIAAILTVVGYSLNDTIVVLDRVRENWKELRSKGIVHLLDLSINQTLSRTINTSLTTLLPVTALFLWGGPVIGDFSLALLAGILVGTYSSIYIAGALLCEWNLRKPEI